MNLWNPRMGIDPRPNLPDLVQRLSLLWNLYSSKDGELLLGAFGGDVPNRERKGVGREDNRVGGDVEGTDSRGTSRLGGNQGLGSDHAGVGGVNSPGNPSLLVRRRGNEGDGKR